MGSDWIWGELVDKIIWWRKQQSESLRLPRWISFGMSFSLWKSWTFFGLQCNNCLNFTSFSFQCKAVWWSCWQWSPWNSCPESENHWISVRSPKDKKCWCVLFLGCWDWFGTVWWWGKLSFLTWTRFLFLWYIRLKNLIYITNWWNQ